MNQHELKRIFSYRRVWPECRFCKQAHTGRGELCLACEDSLKEECVCEKGLPIHQVKEVDVQGQTIEAAL